MTTIIQVRDIPDPIRALDVLPSDYIDVFTATTTEAASASPEQWARVALEDASPVGRFIAWRVLLGLRLESRPSWNHVAGWKIAERGDGWIRLEARSWFMTGNIVFHVDDEHVTFATMIRYDRRIAEIVWTPVSAIHRELAPKVLRHAVRRIDRKKANA